MTSLFTPARQRGTEVLDDPAVPDAVRERAMRDVARANALFGGTRSVLSGLRAGGLMRSLPATAIHLDVGTGCGDIAAALGRDARRAGIGWLSIGLDISEHMTRIARPNLGAAVVGSALRIPLADASADVVTCSQVLHHFVEGELRQLVAELHRVSRGWVIVSDLRRSWAAAGGWWLASGLLRFHEVTRSDGMVSVFRGFTVDELSSVVHDATGVTPRVRSDPFWRLSATWSRQAPPSPVLAQ